LHRLAVQQEQPLNWDLKLGFTAKFQSVGWFDWSAGCGENSALLHLQQD